MVERSTIVFLGKTLVKEFTGGEQPDLVEGRESADADEEEVEVGV